MLQIAGLLFANPSNPASAALCLIFHWGFGGSKTGRCVSQCPAPGRAVTHSVTWNAAGNSGKGLTGEIDNYWLGGLARSFPRSAWECSKGRSASPEPTQSVEGDIPTQSVGTIGTEETRFELWERACSRRGPPSHHKTPRHKKNPPGKHRTGLFNASSRMLKQHSWSCAYQSNAAPHPDPPGSRYPPTRHIPPWQSCAECGA